MNNMISFIGTTAITDILCSNYSLKDINLFNNPGQMLYIHGFSNLVVRYCVP
jgi:hypothetical protein